MSNTSLSCPPYMPYNLTIRKRQITYNEWFASGVENIHGTIQEKDEIVSHGDYIKYFHGTLHNILESNNLTINNEKEFKNELATFIYKISEEPNAMYKKKI